MSITTESGRGGQSGSWSYHSTTAIALSLYIYVTAYYSFYGDGKLPSKVSQQWSRIWWRRFRVGWLAASTETWFTSFILLYWLYLIHYWSHSSWKKINKSIYFADNGCGERWVGGEETEQRREFSSSSSCSPGRWPQVSTSALMLLSISTSLSSSNISSTLWLWVLHDIKLTNPKTYGDMQASIKGPNKDPWQPN